MQGTMSNMSFLSTPGQVTPKGTHLTVYACPSYQQVSLAYEFLTLKHSTQVTFGQGH